jgi:hypothetical protein
MLLILLVAAPALSIQYDSSVAGSQPENTVTEQFTASAGTTYQVTNDGEYLVHNDSATVAYNGTTYSSPDDYRWYPENATLIVSDSTSIPDGVDANVTYQYHEPAQEQQYLAQLTATATRGGGFWGLVAGIGIMIGFIVVLIRAAGGA